jgi:hypothetical protein
MRFKHHLLAGAALGMALYRREPFKIALSMLGSVALDTDHFILYAWRSGDLNPLGAIQYDRRRHKPPRPGDTRPRYGALRSRFHEKRVTLPILALLCMRWPQLRPFALGMTLHLLMDIHPLHFDWRAWQRADGRCERCGVSGLDCDVYYRVPPERGGDRRALANRAFWCGTCAREIASGKYSS